MVALIFMTATSTQRAHGYGVEIQRPFAVKGVSGNIFSSITTTNTMLEGLIVLEGFIITANKGDVSKSKQNISQ